MKRLTTIFLLIVLGATAIFSAQPRRRMTPVSTSATTTQAINETANDTARINAKRRASSTSYIDDRGLTIFVDTITGDEWTDSALISSIPKMEVPLLDAVSMGVNIWDPVMRLTGEKYGVLDFHAELSLHNRYIPIVEVGLGYADYTPKGGNFTYKSPLSVYFKVGADYNFLFNSNPDYQVRAGVRYGLAPFRYSLSNVTLSDSYWGETTLFDVPSQHATAGWLEISAGVRVKLWGPISAAWRFKYQFMLHQSKDLYGSPWYIPGYGTSDITGSFSIIYTFDIQHLNKHKAKNVDSDETPSVDANYGDNVSE